MSLGAGLILGALAVYFPKPRPVAPVPIAALLEQPAPPPVVATTLVPLERVRVSIARLPEPKSTVKPVRKEILTVQAVRHVHEVSPETLCLNSANRRECQAAFAEALEESGLHAAALAASDSPEHAPLRFQKRAAWIRRLETIGKEGIPFMRVPRGPDNELVVGIDRKGVLGFSLRQVSDRDR